MDIAKDFVGKNALVTGSGRGIGRAIAVKLCALGANVYAVSRNPANLASLKSECPSIVSVPVDLGDWDATRVAMEGLPVMDFLVNNAGLLKMGSFLQVTSQDFDAINNVNLKGVINVSQVVVKKMIASGRAGSIVNVSSIAGIVHLPNSCSYSILKAALDHLTKIMAIELGPSNIRVNSINPGIVITDLSLEAVAGGKAMDPDIVRKHHERIPSTSKIVGMEQVVNSTIFLLSSAAPMITGTRLALDGGQCVS